MQYCVADEHLDFHFTEYPMRPFGSFARAWVHTDEFMKATHEWRNAIERRPEQPGELVVDGTASPGIEVEYEGYTATSTAIDGRILTVITHADEPFVDRRVVRRR